MKQRVVVQVILKQGDKVIVLKRSQGSPGLVGKYELPGGTISSGEQPDDALRRHVANSMGINIDHDSLAISDVLSVNSREEGDIQHIFVVYEYKKPVELSQIRLGNSYDSYEQLNPANPKIDMANLRDSAKWILGLGGDRISSRQDSSNVVNTTMNNLAVIIYSDGGSRGNPGPSASAFVIIDNHQNIIDQGGEYIGLTTSNQAEYHGVLLGLERALAIGIKDIEFRVDSMLVVNQLKGLYTVKNKELWPVNEKIRAIIGNFSSVKFTHVPREMNRAADRLVNKLLDEHRDSKEI